MPKHIMTCILLLMIMLLFLTGCQFLIRQLFVPKEKDVIANFLLGPSIDYLPSNNSKVKNGIAYDLFSMDVEKIDTIVVPPKTKVFRTPQSGKCTVLLVKRQQFSGHPPDKISISDNRKGMGFAYKINDEGVLVMEIFGDVPPPRHHGCRVTTLEMMVPEGIDVIESSEKNNAGDEHWIERNKRIEEDDEWIKVVGAPTKIRTIRGE